MRRKSVVKRIEIEALGSLCKRMRKTVVNLIRGHGRGNAPKNLSAGHRLEYMQGPVWLDGIGSLKDATVADNHRDFGHRYAQMAQQVGHGGPGGQFGGHTLLWIVVGYIIPQHAEQFDLDSHQNFLPHRP